ncbi:MAG: hypothetical protein H5T73_07100 [Actinobacteria bacterium]|nr:hypothetical protein [Actinomycetota bacterium]
MNMERKLAGILTIMAIIAIPLTALIIHLPHEQEMDHSMLYLVLAALGVLVIVHHLVILYPSRHGRLFPRLPPLFIGICVYDVIVCAAIYFSGGVSSTLYYAALIGPVAAGICCDLVPALLNTSFLAAAYTLVTVTSGDFAVANVQALACNVLYLFLACYLSSRISLELRRQEQSRNEVATLGEFIRRLEKAKSEFVSVVSHEIRTPLTSIHGFSEILATKDLEPAKRQEFYRIIQVEAERLSSLITNLLNLSRIEAGLELKHEMVDIPRLVTEDVEFFQSQTSSHRLRYLGSRHVPMVYADPERLHQVMKNLLSNAIKYSPDGGPVEVTTEVEGKYVTISVSDRGIGIPAEELPRIFERFSRVEREEVLGISGTGLGLAIVKHIVELHGGKVTVRSEQGQGSTFTVYLPIRGG